jgi:hypothetical protein
MSRNVVNELFALRDQPAAAARLIRDLQTPELMSALPGLFSIGETGARIHAIRDACVVELQRRLLDDHVAALSGLTNEQIDALHQVSDKMLAAIDRMNRSTTRITAIAIAIGAVGTIAGVVATILSAS